MLRRTLLRGTVLAGSAGLAGCLGGGVGGDGSSSTPTADSGSGTTIAMVDTAFDPVKTSVAAGATVRWVNEDSFKHDVTSTTFTEQGADWEVERTVDAGESTSVTFDTPGVYEYYCSIHGKGSMCGVVVVGDASSEGDLPCASKKGGGYY